MAARTRPMRFTLAGLLVVPLVSLVALWAFSASLTLGNAIHERDYNQLVTATAPASDALTNQLSQERLQTFTWLTAGRRAAEAPLLATRQRTDAAIAAYRRVTRATQGLNSPAARTQTAVLLAQLAKISALRAAVDSGKMSPPAAFQAYSSIVDDEFAGYNAANQVDDLSVHEQTAASIDAVRALEYASREAALADGAAAVHGQMNAGDRELFASAVADQRLLIGDALAQFDPQLRAIWSRVYQSPTYRQFAGLENQIVQSVGSKAPIPVSISRWQTVSTVFLRQLQQASAAEAAPLATLASQLGNRLLLEAVLAGGLGLVAVAASVLLMLGFGRRLIRELTGLHDNALSIAEDRLPSVVERLRRGDEVDVAAESPPPAAGKIAEIARVAAAFATVQRTAVQAAVGQADLRKGVNQVFLNLSLRNQSLLHRQLGLLDTMERAASDPAALDDLFRLDHLTTRMRRHAESLIILSGSTPGRGWRDPVLAVDVLRAAIAEIEDYVRVDVVSESRDAIVGPAVNDVIHLIAELVENATAFSPPNTQVEVKADAVGSGFAVEIEDRGLGLEAGEMAEFNERLASPPEFDLASTDQLGLFVVGQLAARHGIRVSLHGSPYGGTRAIVLIPLAIIARDAAASEPPVAGSGGRRALPGSATEPIPAQAGGADATRRASVLTLTGRHRLASESPDGQAFADLGRPAAREVPASQRRAAEPNRASLATAGSYLAGGQQQPRPPETGGLVGDRQAGAGTHLGMPRRVRQASLAPQLRAGGPGSPSTAPPAPAGRRERTPEEARSLMAALQAGWEHGRTDDLDDPGDGPGAATGIETDSADGEAT